MATFLSCQVEHIISQKHGGLITTENLALACIFYNRFKGSDIGSISSITKEIVRFFNPRTDRWSQHFKLEDTRIHSLTEIGEATARILRSTTLTGASNTRLSSQQANIPILLHICT